MAIFCAGRCVEACAAFVAAAFLVEYDAPAVTTTALVALVAGAVLCLMQGATWMLVKAARRDPKRIIMNALFLGASMLCSVAGLKYSGAYRYLFYAFLGQALAGPVAALCGTRSQATPGARGGLVMLASLVLLALSAVFEGGGSARAPAVAGGAARGRGGPAQGAIGLAFMAGTAVLDRLRAVYARGLQVSKAGRPQELHAISTLASGVALAGVAGLTRAVGFSAQPVDMRALPYAFMILFITTYTVVLRHYVSDIGRRVGRRRQVTLVDFVVSGVTGSAIDVFRGVGDCTIYSSLFAGGCLVGLRLALDRVSTDAKTTPLPLYSPASSYQPKTVDD